MSGIAGWVDFSRDLTRERVTILDMTATLACRGPDGEGTWAGRHAALGHRHTAVSGQDRLTRPVVATDGDRTIAVAAHTGVILNHRELRAELSGRGHRFRGGGDAEILLYAYLEWGPDCVTRLDGTFAGAVWDERTEQLLLVRDRIGVEPMYYHPTPTGVLFGSEPKAILAHPDVRAVVDADGLREALTFSGTPHAALFAGMRRLRPGHLLVAGRGATGVGVGVSRYWKVAAAPHTDDLDTTVATVRRLLTENVERILDPDTEVCVMLSGGLDSSAMAGLADRVLRPRGQRVRTFTVGFATDDDTFEPTATRGTRDSVFADDVVARVDAAHTYVALHPAELGDPIVRARVLRAKDHPTPLGDIGTSLYLLGRAMREHATVAMAGDVADTLFGGSGWLRNPEEANAGTFPWVIRGVLRDDPRGLGCGLFDRSLLDELDHLGYAAQRYRDTAAEVPHLDGESTQDRHMRELWYVHLCHFAENLLTHSDRMLKAHGLEARMPFCDHRLAEYTFNVPWAMQNFDGREKSLLRAAVRDVVPDSVAERRKSPFPVTLDPEYEKALRQDLADVLDDPNAPVAPLLDRTAVRRLLDDPDGLTGGGWGKRANVELPLQLNAWLRDYGISLAL